MSTKDLIVPDPKDFTIDRGERHKEPIWLVTRSQYTDGNWKLEVSLVTDDAKLSSDICEAVSRLVNGMMSKASEEGKDNE